MLKKLLLTVGLAVTSSAAQSVDVDPDSIYPYLVPEEYLQFHGDAPHWTLGHGIQIVLVIERDGLVQNLRNEELEQLSMTADAAYDLAVENLDKLLKANAIGMQKLNGPQGKPFILMGGHWATASAILDHGLLDWSTKILGTDEICISIPHREALLIFPRGDEAYRAEMLAMIRDKESDHNKMLTFGLFQYGKDGLRELEQ